MAFTSLFVGALFTARANPLDYQSSTRKNPAFDQLDRLLPAESYPCRSLVQTYSLKLWADLRCGQDNGVSTTKFGVPNGPYEGKVLGVGYEIGSDTIPIFLLTVTRDKEKTVAAGTPIFTTYLFLDSIAFHSVEIRERVIRSAIDRIVAEKIDEQFAVVQIRSVRFMSVGTVTMGAHDDIFLVDGRVWRDSIAIELPGVLVFGSFYPPPRTYVTELNLR